jgi:cytochrome P450
MEKLRSSLEFLDGRPPTMGEIKNLKYLKYFINETLRLYPVVPLNARTALHDTVPSSGGGKDSKSPLLVKKGQRVIFNTYTMHRKEDYFGKNAAEFKPDRWETLSPG